MTHTTSLISRLRTQTAPGDAPWRCCLIAAAALQLCACGGEDGSRAVPIAAAAGEAAGAESALRPAFAPALMTAPADCATRPNDTPDQLLECVTLAGVRAHQTELAAIARANNGTRMAGSPGYDASLAYARKVFTEAGYRVTVQPFEFALSRIHASSLREPGQIAPESIPHLVADYSGSADVTAEVSRPAAAVGCEAADFTGFPRGNIALLRRGGCDLAQKAAAAVQAGAVGLVIYSLDDGALTGSLSAETPPDLPVVLVGKTEGERLAQRTLTGVQLHLQTETSRSMATTYNLLAESTGGDPDHVTMAGAHLDSVRAGAGINDNGSGVAAILETARQMARVQPVNRLRFALWGAEEQGLLGSTYYVRKLDAGQRAKIDLYLNFDMIGSPNHVFEVYGGDGSAGKEAISSPQQSAQIVQFLESFYAQRKLPSKRVNSGGRSDHKPFADAGIPFGGLFTGAEEIKSQQEAATSGGTAGKAFDPCYHRACDNLDNFNAAALDVNADAVANSVLFFAMNRLAR